MTSSTSQELLLQVAEVRDLTPWIRWLRLAPVGGGQLPGFDAGAHVRVRVTLPDGSADWRHYSLINAAVDAQSWQAPSDYVIAVRREQDGRGGSRYMHGLTVGQTVTVEAPRNEFALSDAPHESVLIAGGIGVTPLLSMAAQRVRAGSAVRMVYAGRDRGGMAFVDELTQLLGDRLRLHVDAEQGAPLDVGAVLDACAADVQVYVCGPKPMLDAVLELTHQREWPKARVHFEVFSAPAQLDGDHAYEVVLAQSGQHFTVTADQSLLDALESHGLDPMYDCRRGECGVCAVTVLEGEIDQRDYVLSEREKQEGRVMHPCVSRCKGARLVLDL